MTNAAPKKQVAKTLYLDAGTLEALEFLKSRRPGPGLRFSVPLFFSDFLARLLAHPEDASRLSGWTRRGAGRGKAVFIPLSEADQEKLVSLTDHYDRHAADEQRVRDGKPKIKRLPLSQLFARHIRDQAAQLGWQPAESR